MALAPSGSPSGRFGYNFRCTCISRCYLRTLTAGLKTWYLFEKTTKDMLVNDEGKKGNKLDTCAVLTSLRDGGRRYCVTCHWF